MSKGSHATLGGWEPKTCKGCGERVLVTAGDGFYGLRFGARGEPLEAESWHHRCRRAVFARVRQQEVSQVG